MDMPEHKVRVIAPRVGGGFGPKGGFYPENFLVPWLAVRLGTTVKWIEDRHEHFIASRQERDQTHWVEAAFNNDGKIVGLKNFFLYDTGAYSTSLVVPWITLATIPGPYKIPNLQLEFKAVYTNKVTAMVVRGAGRPQAAYVMEKVMDRIAREIDMDPAEVRRRNFIQKDEYPYSVGILYRDNNPLEYDSGNYPACLEKALEMIGYEDFRKSQLESRKQGVRLGVGIAAYVEGTGFGPYEGGSVKVGTDGKIYVFTGAASQGQGQETALGQICADYLGVDFKNVDVITGDSAAIPHGVGTFASRVMVTAGNAIAQASEQLRNKALELAAHKLECRSEDLDLVNGEIFVKGTPEKKISLRMLAHEAANRVSGFMVDRSVEPGLEATVYYSPRRSTHSNGVHVAVVKVDEETGHVEVQRYAVAHDCGTIINPMLVDGQIHGGVAHGIGNALYEEVIHDDNGQVLNASYMDYYLPGAMEVPQMQVAHIETPTPLNPLGCKGAGEGGTIPFAEDAAPLVDSRISKPLPPCVSIENALAPDAPLVHESEPDNVAGFMKQSTGNVDKAFAEADRVVKETLRVHRGGCHAIETRGIVAHYEPKAGFLTIWASCQGPHRIRRTLLQLMDMPEHKVRVIAPRVGGGFGPKGGFYPVKFSLGALVGRAFWYFGQVDRGPARTFHR